MLDEVETSHIENCLQYQHQSKRQNSKSHADHFSHVLVRSVVKENADGGCSSRCRKRILNIIHWILQFLIEMQGSVLPLQSFYHPLILALSFPFPQILNAFLVFFRWLLDIRNLHSTFITQLPLSALQLRCACPVRAREEVAFVCWLEAVDCPSRTPRTSQSSIWSPFGTKIPLIPLLVSVQIAFSRLEKNGSCSSYSTREAVQ